MQFIAFITSQLPDEVTSQLKPLLRQVENLSTTNEQEAYMLGSLLKRAVKQGEVPKALEEQVHQIAKRSPQRSYYERQQKQEFDDWLALYYCLVIMGVLSVIAGIHMIIENSFIISFHIVYLVQTVKGGGYMLILGLVFLWGGLSKLKQQYRLRSIYR